MYKFLISDELDLAMNESSFGQKFFGIDYKDKSEFDLLELNIKENSVWDLKDLDNVLVKALSSLSVPVLKKDDSILYYLSKDEIIESQSIWIPITFSWTITIHIKGNDTKNLIVKEVLLY